MKKNTSSGSLYRQLVPIDSHAHLTIKLKDNINYSFAKNCNAIPITSSEFEKVSKIYPILFVKEADRIVPVALLGLHHNQNLFLKWNHQWDAAYIPAYIQRYPFSLASIDNKQDGDYVVCIDEQSPLISKQGTFSLFEKNGKHSLYLKEKINFLQELQLEFEKTINFSNFMQSLELFEPMSANVNLVNGEAFSITGFYTISKEKFKNLDKETCYKLMLSDDMKLIYEHFGSLDNFSCLIDKAMDKKTFYVPGKSTNNHSRNKKSTNKSGKTKHSASKAQVL